MSERVEHGALNAVGGFGPRGVCGFMSGWRARAELCETIIKQFANARSTMRHEERVLITGACNHAIINRSKAAPGNFAREWCIFTGQFAQHFFQEVCIAIKMGDRDCTRCMGRRPPPCRRRNAHSASAAARTVTKMPRRTKSGTTRVTRSLSEKSVSASPPVAITNGNAR